LTTRLLPVRAEYIAFAAQVSSLIPKVSAIGAGLFRAGRRSFDLDEGEKKAGNRCD
jgi:hypothetical protein